MGYLSPSGISILPGPSFALFPAVARFANPAFSNLEWADKKVVLFAVPGAFTPTCSADHLPGYIRNLEKFKTKGVDVVAVVAYNDAWVMSAWGKANGIKDESIVSLPVQHYLHHRSYFVPPNSSG
jgi:peroxiredoxin